MVAGEMVMTDGALTRVDEAAIHEEAQEIVARLYAGLPDRMRKFEALRPLMQKLERAANGADLAFNRYCC